MDVFVARQPIFDTKQAVYGYELLFRSGPDNFALKLDDDIASGHVVTDSLSVFGLDRLTSGRKAFIHLSPRMLAGELYSLLPRDGVVLELPETIKPSPDTLAACGTLKRAGYLLALDNFVEAPGYEPLIELADFLKIDFSATEPRERRRLAERYAGCKQLIAAKVETIDLIQEGVSLSYQYFQGFFFCRPEMVSRKEVPGFKLNYLQFIKQMSASDLDFDELEQIVRREVSLCVRLLRLLNAPVFGSQVRVRSLKQALILLGETAIRRWATMIALDVVAEDKPDELVTTCLIRARLCELLGRAAGLVDSGNDLFLVGLLSLVDVLVGRPLEELLDELAVSDEIRAGLLDERRPESQVRSLAIALERGAWEAVSRLGSELGIDQPVMPPLYAEAVDWAHQVFGR